MAAFRRVNEWNDYYKGVVEKIETMLDTLKDKEGKEKSADSKLIWITYRVLQEESKIIGMVQDIGNLFPDKLLQIQHCAKFIMMN